MKVSDVPLYIKGFIVEVKSELGVHSSPLKSVDFVLKKYGDTVLASEEDQEKNDNCSIT